METQKTVNLLNGSEDLNSKFAKRMDNMAEEMKMKMIQPLNLKQKSLNQIFAITLMQIFL